MAGNSNLRHGRAAALGAALVLWLIGAPAGASSVDVFFDGAGGFGISDTTKDLVVGAGAPLYPVASDAIVADPSGSLFSLASSPEQVPASEVGGSGTFADPRSALVTVTLSPLFDDPSFDTWLIFLGHEPNDPTGSFYDTQNMGLRIDPMTDEWAVFNPLPDVYYLGFHVGPLGLNEPSDILLEYLVAQSLYLHGTTPEGGDLFMFPQYWVAYTNFSVPEPAVGLLLGVGLVGLALRRVPC